MSDAPKKAKNQVSVSVSRETFARLKKRCQKLGVPIGAIVELTAARAIGMPVTELPERVQRWAHLIPDE